MSGLYAWDEDTAGAEIGGTKGKTKPMPESVEERLIRLWASPQGAPKAALGGTTVDDITFIYTQYADAGGGLAEFRIIPTDGREHGADAEYAATYYGDTVGHWEGDTLVLDSIGFNDRTWFGRGGFFQTDQMHVVERFTRLGNTILYEVTVEDPEVLVEPSVLTPRVLVPNPNHDAKLIPERGYCEVYEDIAETNQIRH